MRSYEICLSICLSFAQIWIWGSWKYSSNSYNVSFSIMLEPIIAAHPSFEGSHLVGFALPWLCWQWQIDQNQPNFAWRSSKPALEWPGGNKGLNLGGMGGLLQIKFEAMRVHLEWTNLACGEKIALENLNRPRVRTELREWKREGFSWTSSHLQGPKFFALQFTDRRKMFPLAQENCSYLTTHQAPRNTERPRSWGSPLRHELPVTQKLQYFTKSAAGQMGGVLQDERKGQCRTNGKSIAIQMRGILQYKWKAWLVFPIPHCPEEEKHCSTNWRFTPVDWRCVAAHC